MNRQQQATRNRARRALQQARAFLKANGISARGMKQTAIIKVAFEMKGLAVVEGRSLLMQLIELWASRDDEHIHQMEAQFYRSPEWCDLRDRVLKHYGTACMNCGDHGDPTVDHVKPRSLFPALELDFDNMQVLCRSCNSSKSNRHETDYREIVCTLGECLRPGTQPNRQSSHRDTEQGCSRRTKGKAE